MIYVKLTETEIKIPELYTRLVDAKYGGINIFIGTVREWTENIQTTQIDYTAYKEMAIKELTKLAKEVEATYKANVVAVHRLGILEIKDIAVFIGVATAHRKESYEGTRYMIENLKKHVPIWKKEYDTDKTRWGGLSDDKN